MAGPISPCKAMTRMPALPAGASNVVAAPDPAPVVVAAAAPVVAVPAVVVASDVPVVFMDDAVLVPDPAPVDVLAVFVLMPAPVPAPVPVPVSPALFVPAPTPNGFAIDTVVGEVEDGGDCVEEAFEVDLGEGAVLDVALPGVLEDEMTLPLCGRVFMLAFVLL